VLGWRRTRRSARECGAAHVGRHLRASGAVQQHRFGAARAGRARDIQPKVASPCGRVHVSGARHLRQPSPAWGATHSSTGRAPSCLARACLTRCVRERGAHGAVPIRRFSRGPQRPFAKTITRTAPEFGGALGFRLADSFRSCMASRPAHRYRCPALAASAPPRGSAGANQEDRPPHPRVSQRSPECQHRCEQMARDRLLPRAVRCPPSAAVGNPPSALKPGVMNIDGRGCDGRHRTQVHHLATMRSTDARMCTVERPHSGCHRRGRPRHRGNCRTGVGIRNSSASPLARAAPAFFWRPARRERISIHVRARDQDGEPSRAAVDVDVLAAAQPQRTSGEQRGRFSASFTRSTTTASRRPVARCGTLDPREALLRACRASIAAAYLFAAASRLDCMCRGFVQAEPCFIARTNSARSRRCCRRSSRRGRPSGHGQHIDEARESRRNRASSSESSAYFKRGLRARSLRVSSGPTRATSGSTKAAAGTVE